jgi:hypothetical protein
MDTTTLIQYPITESYGQAMAMFTGIESVLDCKDCSKVIPDIKISISIPTTKLNTTIANVSAAAWRMQKGAFELITLPIKN